MVIEIWQGFVLVAHALHVTFPVGSLKENCLKFACFIPLFGIDIHDISFWCIHNIQKCLILDQNVLQMGYVQANDNEREIQKKREQLQICLKFLPITYTCNRNEYSIILEFQIINVTKNNRGMYSKESSQQTFKTPNNHF